MKPVRPPAVAGSFYPADQQELAQQVQHFLGARRAQSTRRPRFLLVPHAGYLYSGQVAASAFKEVSGTSFERVLLLGPSHRYYFEGAAATLDRVWETPLGQVSISRPGYWALSESKYHAAEHSLEVQLPFIQTVLPDARLMPFLLSGPTELAPQLAEALLPLMDERTLVVVSSDFNHVGPSFKFYAHEQGFGSAEEMDRAAIETLSAGDRAGFTGYLKRTEATICGALPILTAMCLMESLGLGPWTFKEYANSAQVTAGPNQVGYAAFYA
ncbi:MAG: AmmeMemoRadiSam system protein B [bacterium]|nr:AmmeMemoRadiSam system protein B [bacterium]